ncbi:hypothetical protein OG21DRAFT_962856 [Imleria badia]|nr:hypothetical protein OG21DRAFT_962856 [Imleria badia]
MPIAVVAFSKGQFVAKSATYDRHLAAATLTCECPGYVRIKFFTATQTYLLLLKSPKSTRPSRHPCMNSGGA